MILELLIEFVLGVIKVLISLVPTFSLPEGFSAVLDDATSFLSMGAYFLPLSTIVICFTVIFLVDNIKFIMSIVNWLIAKIPTIS